LFFEQHIQFMADEIRGGNKIDEFAPHPEPCPQPPDNGSVNGELRTPVPTEAQHKQARGLAAKTRVEQNAEEMKLPPMTVDVGRTSSSCTGGGSRIYGKIEFRVGRIEGEAEGEITGDEIEIAASAVVKANITANRVKVGGRVTGEIIARERIELLPTAHLRSVITTPRLVVAEGAQFDGQCKMPNRPATPQLESRGTKEREASLVASEAEKAALKDRGYSPKPLL
jgi:cytoskeletal protein CcmA (bactofilin family)